MNQLSAVDLSFLVQEFKLYEQARINTIYYDGTCFYFDIYKAGIGTHYLKIHPGIYCSISYEKNFQAKEHHFSQALRKHLKSATLLTIEQIPDERIIELHCKKAENSFKIIIECFKPGNIVVTEQNNTIINLLYTKKFKNRLIKIGETYQAPEKREEFSSSLCKADQSIVKILASCNGLGGKYAEEILKTLTIDKNTQANTLTDIQISTITEKIKQLKEKQIEAKTYLSKEGEITYVLPFPSQCKTTLTEKSYSSFHDAVTAYFNQFENKTDKKTLLVEAEKKKLNHRLGQLEESYEESQKEIEKLTQKGNIIYEHYTQIQELLQLAKTDQIPKDIAKNITFNKQKGSLILNIKKG